MARVGYTRVSTIDQNLDRQLDGIDVDRVFADKISGKNTHRPALEELLEYVRAGDTVLVPNPAYPIHPYGFVIAGADVRHVPLVPGVDFFEELRRAITLREIDGMSYEEIAELMQCPIGTVRSRIFRAREAVAGKLRPMLENRSGKRW